MLATHVVPQSSDPTNSMSVVVGGVEEELEATDAGFVNLEKKRRMDMVAI